MSDDKGGPAGAALVRFGRVLGRGLCAAAARYARVDAVLAMTKRAHVTAMGFVGNEAYARF